MIKNTAIIALNWSHSASSAHLARFIIYLFVRERERKHIIKERHTNILKSHYSESFFLFFACFDF